MSRELKALAYVNELSHAMVRIKTSITRGVQPDPEDFVVLRGSSEALIELAEETDGS